MEGESHGEVEAAAKPHFVVIPFMEQGHMIPMVDMARLLAQRGALVSFITTPVNAARIRPIIDHSLKSGSTIRFVELRFPAAEAGLPEGCENFDLIKSDELIKPFIESASLMADQIELHLRQRTPAPDCMISDSLQYWTAELSQRLGIPRVIFHGPSCFYLFCALKIKREKIFDGIAVDDSKRFPIPDLPQTIEIMKGHVRRMADSPGWEKLRDQVNLAEETAAGVVLNTYEELEPWYIEAYRKAIGKDVWPIGPLSLYKEADVGSRAARGRASSIDTEILLRWLATKKQSSVIYVSFGSICRNSRRHLIEIGRGLKASNVAFIWVVKEVEVLEEWLKGFEQRSTEEKGLVIRGWAPQTVILSHPAVGGFVTHCGWNSVLEAISVGVPMVTWPRFGDQFLNERLVVDVLRIGVSVGATKVQKFVPLEKREEEEEEEDEAAVKRDDVARAVVSLMEGGEEGEERRVRARDLREKAVRAMAEGGSSSENLKNFVIKYASHLRVIDPYV
ncbi:UDP-glycosyltransferase 73C3 [Apostasia shenzhenica]|uniref:Glycosyltransferase n=1 Tax=Apostasia shenzhenica TaxID=1088818 RepID=A0A2H9ZU00_9ASPA|nr:UDP-glycosyltransferase 73C3 [Apostasia shenzhenica]